MSRSFLALVALAALVGCGNEGMAPVGPTCGSAGRSGQSDCSGVTTCNAGQYCDDSGFPTCTPGCTSDLNCGPNELCARPVGEAIGACQSCPVCGNGVCEGGESSASCPGDCGGGAMCGNGVCEAGEAGSCPADCASGPVCGNGVCEAGEPGNCTADCPTGPVCGNLTCEPGESPATCPADCQDDDSLFFCRENCNAYNFFDCFDAVALGACRERCVTATMSQRESFNACANTGTVSCDTSCLVLLE